MTDSQGFTSSSSASASDEDTRFLDRGTGRIAYDLAGSGPLIIGVPGMGDLRSTFRHLTPALIAAGHRVATMDLRGQGDSDLTFDSFDDPAASSDIVALAEHLGEPAIVIGISMGAAAAVIAAAEHPEAIRGLVLMGPFVRDLPSSALQRWTMRAVMGGPWARRAWLTYLPKFYPTRRGEDFLEHKERIARALARPGYTRAFRAVTRTSHAPSEAVLDQVHTPVLVVMGTKDPDFPDQRAEAASIADRLHGRVEMITDAGHYPQAEFPELTTPVVLDFARQLDNGPADA
jgi:pimeloyl-ACP methyl ester carboxylesterase